MCQTMDRIGVATRQEEEEDEIHVNLTFSIQPDTIYYTIILINCSLMFQYCWTSIINSIYMLHTHTHTHISVYCLTPFLKS